MLNSDLSPAAPQGGMETPPDKTRVVSTRRRVQTNWVSDRTLQPSIDSVVAISFVPSDFLVDGHVSGLGNVHPLLTLNFLSTWILPLHVVLFPLILCTKPFGEGSMDDWVKLRIELAASSSYSARRRLGLMVAE